MHAYPLHTGTHAPMAIYTPSAIAAGLWWRRPVTSVGLKLGALTTQARLEMQRQSTFWTGSEEEEEEEEEEESSEESIEYAACRSALASPQGDRVVVIKWSTQNVHMFAVVCR